MLETFAIVSAVSFLFFGTSCLLTQAMRAEFVRYGLSRFRVLTGYLQLLGAAGLFAGLWWTPIGAAAAAGLALLMVFGVGARQRIGDPWPQQVPAAFYAVLNAILAVGFLLW